MSTSQTEQLASAYMSHRIMVVSPVVWNCLFSSEYACICYALGKGNSRENCALISVSVRV